MYVCESHNALATTNRFRSHSSSKCCCQGALTDAESGSLYTFRKNIGKWERTSAGLFFCGEKWGASQYEIAGPGGAVPRVNERQLNSEKVRLDGHLPALLEYPEHPQTKIHISSAVRPIVGSTKRGMICAAQFCRDTPHLRRDRHSALSMMWCVAFDSADGLGCHDDMSPAWAGGTS